MDKEFWSNEFFKLVRLLLGNAWNRTGSAIALAGVGALTGWLDKFVMAVTNQHWEETAQWVGWALLFIGIGMLAYGARKAHSANPHDVELIKDFREAFDRSDIDFLTNHNFADNWHRSRTKCFEDIADDWIGAQFDFVDQKLNKLLDRVKELSKELADAESYGFNIGPNLQLRTMRTMADQGTLTPQTRAKVNNLNRLARELAKAVNALEHSAKIRIPIA
ncbi:hypothetical protein FDV58_27705 [Bradyrhizobium elkanii]|uniref:Uncharacterized protein n=1 Tax=Bradyrhizobium elkanii TaxID=29448 RepID=A0A4U6RUH3_BRAEL|nr:DUF202 domain-containing protein [Bradyrhizobium elkanii]TKV77991.1 hypothetical protein FDV58_27705 [Bradyrhizobium elkanii]